MKKLLFILIVFFPGLCLAHDPLSKQDIIFQTAITAMQIIDWGQTRDIACKPEEFIERNIIMGKHPSIQEVNWYFAGSILSSWAILYILPSEYRPYFQGFEAGISGFCIVNNEQLGIGINLRF